MKVKIYGAGSIGNHLSNASRRCGWAVDLVDRDPKALERTRFEIYPARYGKWDDAIRLFESKDAPEGGYDLIIVGTPPDSHVSLATSAIKESPRAIMVEKPFCTPDMKGAQELVDLALERSVRIFTGYDHVVGAASEKFCQLASSGCPVQYETLDVEFREFWGGIFAAHPWLSGPEDSYLGFWKRGGGASCEHSHAINLWQHFAHTIGAGRIIRVSAMMDHVNDGALDYDKLAAFNLRTENGLSGRVVQDVITNPPRKWACLQGAGRSLEWQCGYRAGTDAVIEETVDTIPIEHLFTKTRPDDFIRELHHIEKVLDLNLDDLSISMARGLDTMLVIAAAHRSNFEKREVTIDYSVGYSLKALK